MNELANLTDSQFRKAKQGFPVFLSQPAARVYTTRSSPALIVCRAAGSIQINIVCNKKDRNVKTKLTKPSSTGGIQIAEGSIKIRQQEILDLFDDFWCQCKAWSVNRHPQANEVTFIVTPKFFIHDAYLDEDFSALPDPVISVGYMEKVKLPCIPPHGVPKPTVFWTRNDRNLQVNSNKNLRLVTRSPGRGDIPIANLTIVKLQFSDAGSYRCFAQNLIGKRVSRKITVKISNVDEWMGWSEWSSCSAIECGEVGTRARTRVCVTKPGTPERCIPEHTNKETSSCTATAKCQGGRSDTQWDSWFEWSSWGKCSTTVKCANSASTKSVDGVRTRTRVCNTAGKMTARCLGSDQMTSACKTNCQVDLWSSWQEWSACQKDCTQSRQRICKALECSSSSVTNGASKPLNPPSQTRNCTNTSLPCHKSSGSDNGGANVGQGGRGGAVPPQPRRPVYSLVGGRPSPPSSHGIQNSPSSYPPPSNPGLSDSTHSSQGGSGSGFSSSQGGGLMAGLFASVGFLCLLILFVMLIILRKKWSKSKDKNHRYASGSFTFKAPNTLIGAYGGSGGGHGADVNTPFVSMIKFPPPASTLGRGALGDGAGLGVIGAGGGGGSSNHCVILSDSRSRKNYTRPSNYYASWAGSTDRLLSPSFNELNQQLSPGALNSNSGSTPNGSATYDPAASSGGVYDPCSAPATAAGPGPSLQAQYHSLSSPPPPNIHPLACAVLSSFGGRISLPDSGVILTVPSDALPTNTSSELYIGICSEQKDRPKLADGETLLSSIITWGGAGPGDQCHLDKPAVLSFRHCASLVKNDNWTFSIKENYARSPDEPPMWKHVLTIGEESLGGMDHCSSGGGGGIFCQVDPAVAHVMIDRPAQFALVGRSREPLGNPASKLLRVAAFGPHLSSQSDINIRVYALDDTDNALEHVIELEDRLGAQLLNSPFQMRFYDGGSDPLIMVVENVESDWLCKPCAKHQVIPFHHVWSSSHAALHSSFMFKCQESHSIAQPLRCQLRVLQQGHTPIVLTLSLSLTLTNQSRQQQPNILPPSSTATGTSHYQDGYENVYNPTVDYASAGTGSGGMRRNSNNFGCSMTVEMPHQVFRLSNNIKRQLCLALDMPNSAGNDWRTLARAFNVDRCMAYFGSKESPTEQILDLWEARSREDSALSDLIQIFKLIDRPDCANVIERDINRFSLSSN